MRTMNPHSALGAPTCGISAGTKYILEVQICRFMVWTGVEFKKDKDYSMSSAEFQTSEKHLGFEKCPKIEGNQLFLWYTIITFVLNAESRTRSCH